MVEFADHYLKEFVHIEGTLSESPNPPMISSWNPPSEGAFKVNLDGYTDADMAGDIDSRKPTSGYLMTFAGGAVSWQSKLQKCVIATVLVHHLPQHF